MKLLYIFLFISLFSCQENDRVKSQILESNALNNTDLDDYWYNGKAEITTYYLLQNRYQDIHPGEVILIFVTEDFRTDIQVKNDSYSNPNTAPILKYNKIKRFTTGLYDYSMMTSVFTLVNKNVDYKTLKVTMSSQDWCGQSYHQLNYEDENYKSMLHSYFEKEGDKNEVVKGTLLEDEILNLIRIDPNNLPQGDLNIIPSLEYLRLKHKKTAAIKAIGVLQDYEGEEWDSKDIRLYQLEFPSEMRTLKIYFERKKPYKILGWDDEYPSVFDNKKRISKARKNQESYVAYWELNDLGNTQKRKELNLK